MRSFLHDCWPLVAAFALATLCTVCFGADQKPLVINPTTGKQEQLQSGNTLSLPANYFSQAVTVTDPVAATTIINANLATFALTGANANRIYNRWTATTSNNAFNYTNALGLRAVYGTVSHVGTGTVTGMAAVSGDLNLSNTGTITRAIAGRFTCPTVDAAGTITTGNGVYIAAPAISGGGVITTNNALEIEAMTGAGTNRAIYTQGAGLVVISDTTSASSSTVGAVTIGNGAAATSVAIGGGNINLGAQLNASRTTGTGVSVASTATSQTAASSCSIFSSGGLGITSDMVMGANSATGAQKTLRIYGGNTAADRAPVLSLFRSSSSEIVLAPTANGLFLGTGGGAANFNDTTIEAYAQIKTTTTGVTNLTTTEATSVNAASQIVTGGQGVAKRSFLGTIGSTFKGNVLAGVQDGTADTAGAVGEVLSGSASSTAVAATGTVGNVCSVSLTPGAWMITGSFTINQGTTGLTTGSVVNCSIVTTTATNGTQGTTMNQDSALLTANGFKMMSAPTVTANISATTTYYLTEQCSFTAGSPTVSGKITAVRIR